VLGCNRLALLGIEAASADMSKEYRLSRILSNVDDSGHWASFERTSFGNCHATGS
jgi:hypothetical protein